MVTETHLANYAQVVQEFNKVIMDVVTSPAQSAVIGNGIARIQKVSNVDFASIEHDDPDGELYLVQDDEALPPSHLPGMTAQKAQSAEFGRYVPINQSQINALVGNVIEGSNIKLDLLDQYQKAKEHLVGLAYKQLTQQAVVRILKSVYQSLEGNLSYLRKTGGTKTRAVGITAGGSVSTAWSTVASAPVLTDMVAIEAALLALAEPGTITTGHTVVGRSVMQYIRQNKQVIEQLFPYYVNLPYAVPQTAFDTNAGLGEYFGKIVEDNARYKAEGGGSYPTYLDTNYIVCTTGTQQEPVVDVYIAPTGLDPKYSADNTGTGFSTHIYDGLLDTASRSDQVGLLTVGIRGKIAVRVRKPKRIYRKKVLNI